MGLRDSNKCECCQVVDFIEHFFFECNKVKPVWKSCCDYIFRLTGENINLSITSILFGYNPHCIKSPHIKTINHLILLAKMTISKFKYGSAFDIVSMFEYELRLRKLWPQEE